MDGRKPIEALHVIIMNLDAIYNKSCESMDEVEGESVDLIVTSPPYDVEKPYEKNKLGLKEYKKFTISWMSEAFRVLKRGGRMCVNIAATGRKPYAPLPSYISTWPVDEIDGFLHRGLILWFKLGRRGDSTCWGSWRSPSSPFLRDTTEMIAVLLKQGDPCSDKLAKGVAGFLASALEAGDEGMLKKVLMSLRDPAMDGVLGQVSVFSKESYKKKPRVIESEKYRIDKDDFMRDTISFWGVPITDVDLDLIDYYEPPPESSSVWNMRCETGIKWHPAPFPVELARRCIRLFSFPGDIVLDPFAGSGQTAVACLTMEEDGSTSPERRHFILYEREKAYATKIKRRLRKYMFKKLTEFSTELK